MHCDSSLLTQLHAVVSRCTSVCSQWDLLVLVSPDNFQRRLDLGRKETSISCPSSLMRPHFNAVIAIPGRPGHIFLAT